MTLDARLMDALSQQDREMASDYVEANPALQALTDSASEPAVLTAAQRLLHDGAVRRRILGARILGGAHMAVEVAGASLVAALADEPDHDAILWEISSIDFLGYRPAVSELLRFTRHPDPEVRYKTASALSASSWPNPSDAALAALLGLSKDPDADVRFSAIYELSNWWSEGFRNESVRDVLNDHQADEDRRVRDAVVGAIREP